MVADLTAGNAIKVAAGGFADRHALGGKGSADVAEIAFVLRSSIFLGSQFSHVNGFSMPAPLSYFRVITPLNLLSSNVIGASILERYSLITFFSSSPIHGPNVMCIFSS